jgi:hypothetical protein
LQTAGRSPASSGKAGGTPACREAWGSGIIPIAGRREESYRQGRFAPDKTINLRIVALRNDFFNHHYVESMKRGRLTIPTTVGIFLRIAWSFLPM